MSSLQEHPHRDSPRSHPENRVHSVRDSIQLPVGSDHIPVIQHSQAFNAHTDSSVDHQERTHPLPDTEVPDALLSDPGDHGYGQEYAQGGSNDIHSDSPHHADDTSWVPEANSSKREHSSQSVSLRRYEQTERHHAHPTNPVPPNVSSGYHNSGPWSHAESHPIHTRGPTAQYQRGTIAPEAGGSARRRSPAINPPNDNGSPWAGVSSGAYDTTYPAPAFDTPWETDETVPGSGRGMRGYAPVASPSTTFHEAGNQYILSPVYSQSLGAGESSTASPRNGSVQHPYESFGSQASRESAVTHVPAGITQRFPPPSDPYIPARAIEVDEPVTEYTAQSASIPLCANSLPRDSSADRTKLSTTGKCYLMRCFHVTHQAPYEYEQERPIAGALHLAHGFRPLFRKGLARWNGKRSRAPLFIMIAQYLYSLNPCKWIWFRIQLMQKRALPVIESVLHEADSCLILIYSQSTLTAGQQVGPSPRGMTRRDSDVAMSDAAQMPLADEPHTVHQGNAPPDTSTPVGAATAAAAAIPPSKPGREANSDVGLRRKDKQSQKGAPTAPTAQNSVREMMEDLLGFGDKSCFRRPHPPADLKDVAAFLNGSGGPNLEDLRLDLATTGNGDKSQWNIRADSHHEGEISKVVLSTGTRRNPNTRRAFTPGYEEEQCTPSALTVYPINDSHQLFKFRKRACKLGGPLAVLKPLMDLVDDEMISEDETDAERSTKRLKVFRRVEKYWVNPELTRIFHVLVDVHLDILNAFGEHGAGSSFRQRVNHPPARVVTSGVVVGLPANFYNPQWVATLLPVEKKELRMGGNVDLTPFIAMISG
ncbi:hypothetical protein AURDEDRAFT_126954 [Auricularia subglabra TFB-10046 SS5]|nr:hypothetical protein AURDEDRAFT_126954 [Auricularia subglabra TFB-10046 SS5]